MGTGTVTGWRRAKSSTGALRRSPFPRSSDTSMTTKSLTRPVWATLTSIDKHGGSSRTLGVVPKGRGMNHNRPCPVCRNEFINFFQKKKKKKKKKNVLGFVPPLKKKKKKKK